MDSIKSKLIQIQKNKKEDALFPYLQQLFISKGFKDVEITHGKDEFGKDLVFKSWDEKLSEEIWYAIVVKNKDAGTSVWESQGEIRRQIDQCFTHPFKDNKGKDRNIARVIVVVNGTVSTQAKETLSKSVPSFMLTNVFIWNYQKIVQEIFDNIKSAFLGTYQVEINSFRIHQDQFLRKINTPIDPVHGLSIDDVNEIYINAKTTYSKYIAQVKTYSNYEKSTSISKNEEIDDALSILNSNKNFIIHGIATSGKSLLLRRIGYHSIKKEAGKAIIPFFFELGKIDHPQSFDIKIEIIRQFKEITQAGFNETEFQKIVILLDGLDEVINDSNKFIVLTKIRDFLDKETPNLYQIILSSRVINLIQETKVLGDFEIVELLPFDVGQAYKLVKKLIPNNSIKTQSFINAIKEDQLSHSLTRTPMALTLMAILYKDDQIDLDELPANITELYNKFSDYYLNRWDVSKGISLQYKYEEAKQILALIAKRLQQKGGRKISVSDLKLFLLQLKSEYGFEELNNIDEFINGLKKRSGLVLFDEDKSSFEFYHLSFQEFFASLSYDDSNEDELLQNYFNEWWHNLIIFYCGKSPKRDVFLKKIKDKVIPIDLQQHFIYMSLLSKCVQACYLAPKASKKIVVKRLIKGFDNFYKQLIDIEKHQKAGLLYNFSTLDFIIQLRDYFSKLLSSKHLPDDLLIQVWNEISSEDTDEFSDITMYSLSYFLAYKFRDAKYFENLMKRSDLQLRWSRIVYVDVNSLKLNSERIDEKVWRKIKRKQSNNKEAIRKQFRMLAFKNL